MGMKSAGCDQICIPEGEVATCVCDTGYTLNSDGKTCDSCKYLLSMGRDTRDILFRRKSNKHRHLKEEYTNYDG